MSERSMEIHCAKVFLHQARHFRLRGEAWFSATLLQWAGNSRRRAQAATQEAALGVTGDLFGGA